MTLITSTQFQEHILKQSIILSPNVYHISDGLMVLSNQLNQPLDA